ncbi:MAG: hypothetical protein P4L84_37875 [Isosphaeraceae bacterium]|nr:hypothetical protein [Isosphaeraceae bacterium]
MRTVDEPEFGSQEWNSRVMARANRWKLLKEERLVHGGPYYLEHRQVEPADVWLVEHGWGRKPHVQVLSPDGEVVIAEVHHLDDDRLEIRFAGPSAGSAVLSLGATPTPVVATDQRPKEARGFTERQIRVAAHEVRGATGKTPSRLRVARELDTSESTLARAMEDLHMPGWPPAPPDD